jgi:hypothetical protein
MARRANLARAAAILAALLLGDGFAMAADALLSPGPAAAVRVTTMPHADFTDTPPASVSAREYQFSAAFGAVPVAAGALSIGADYQYTRYEYAGVPGRDRDLHRLQLPLRFAREAGNGQLHALVAPGIATSSNVMKDAFRRATRQDLYATAALIVRQPLGDTLSWEAGLAYDRALGKPALYPSLGLSGTARDGLTWRLGFPESALAWTPSDRSMLGLRVFPAGAEWHVATDDFADAFPYRVRATRAELTFSRTVGRRLIVDLTAGYEFAREHDFVAERSQRFDTDVASQATLSIGIRYGRIAVPHPNTPRPAMHEAESAGGVGR